MFRKFFAVAVALTLCVGGLFAEEIKGVFKKFEGEKVTIDVEGKDKTYKVNSSAKQKYKKEETLVTDVLKNWKDGDKGTFTLDKDEVTKVAKERKQ